MDSPESERKDFLSLPAVFLREISNLSRTLASFYNDRELRNAIFQNAPLTRPSPAHLSHGHGGSRVIGTAWINFFSTPNPILRGEPLPVFRFRQIVWLNVVRCHGGGCVWMVAGRWCSGAHTQWRTSCMQSTLQTVQSGPGLIRPSGTLYDVRDQIYVRERRRRASAQINTLLDVQTN